MPSILYVDHAEGVGGAEQLLLLILKHLDHNRWQPHLACPPGPFAAAAMAQGTPVHLVPLPRLRRSARFPLDWQGVARSLARLARDLDVALLHANTVRAAIYTAPAAKLTQRPFLWHMHDFWLGENRPDRSAPDRWGKQLLCGLSAQVIANSRAVANNLPCSDQVTVIHNGIETDWFEQETDGEAFRRQYNIPEGVPVVGMVGRLRPWKGQEAFLHAAARIKQALPTTHFLVVGGNPFQTDGDYANRLRTLTATLGASDQVIFTGQLPDVRPALAAMDVFVHPGQPEPFGLVNIEAMAMAKPIVAFAHGALPEIIVNGETGLLVLPGDEQGMVQALAKLLDEPQLAIEMGEAGRERVEQHFTIQQTVRGIEQVYAQALSRKG